MQAELHDENDNHIGHVVMNSTPNIGDIIWYLQIEKPNESYEVVEVCHWASSLSHSMCVYVKPVKK